jgi:hypothetical protein
MRGLRLLSGGSGSPGAAQPVGGYLIVGLASSGNHGWAIFTSFFHQQTSRPCRNLHLTAP